MTDRQLYVCPVPGTGQREQSNQQEIIRQLSAQGLLDQDTSAVESLSTNPGDVTLNGQYRGQYADLMAFELQELSNSSGYEKIPYNAPNEKTTLDGYYSVQSMDVGRVDSGSKLVQQYQGSLSKAGTHHSHYRAITTESRQLDHPFGNSERVEIGVPATASDVRWVHRETGEWEDAESIATRTGEHGGGGQADVDVYDREDSSFSSPDLVYDIDYADEGPLDCRVWDTRGHDDRDDENDIPQWQKVFVSTHDFEAGIVVENALLELRFDRDADPGLQVREWDSGTEEWTAVDLGDTTAAQEWSLLDVDIGHRSDQDLGPVTVDVLTRWEHTDGSTYPLDMSLQRGHDAALVSRTPNASSPIPVGLEELLKPIASTALLDGQPSRTLRARSEVSE